MNKIVKRILIVLVVIMVGLSICDEYKTRYITQLSIEGLQKRIDTLTRANNNLLSNVIEVGGLVQDLGRNLEKYKGEETETRFTDLLRVYSEIYELENQIRDVDINYILNGSVFVQGMGGTGSGTIIKKINEEMYILTAYHVIEENAELAKVGFDVGVTVGYPRRDTTGRIAGMILYGAKIIKTDEDNDLALLKTSYDDENLNEMSLAITNPKIGDIIYSVGNPLGFVRTISKGILCNIIEDFYISDNTCTYGNSGGGLFNKTGELIGVPVQVGYIYDLGENNSLSPETSLGKSVKLPVIKEFLKDII
jgi:S1-C subfamily serine protease